MLALFIPEDSDIDYSQRQCSGQDRPLVGFSEVILMLHIY